MGENCCAGPRVDMIEEEGTNKSEDHDEQIDAYPTYPTDQDEVKIYIQDKEINESKSVILPKINFKLDASVFVEDTPIEIDDSNDNNRFIKPSRSVLRCITNFKIEPLYFRNEKEKSLLYERYNIESVIGKGSYGVVKKIWDRVTETYRSLKIISKEN